MKKMKLNKEDMKYLELNWDSLKEKSNECQCKITLTISNICYADFGTIGLTVYKYKQNKWYEKTINYWKGLSFSQFLLLFHEKEWEET